MTGELTGGNVFASIYLGRGRQSNAEMQPPNQTFALDSTIDTDQQYYIRDTDHFALDSAAFHYTIYRSL